MSFDYLRMKPEHIDGVIDCVYQAWKDNAWFQKASEKDIKQSIFDRINHYGLMEKTVICIQKDTNKVVGVLFGQNVQTYLDNSMKWNFHHHLEIVEEFIKLVCQKMSLNYDQLNSIWPFWLTSTVSNSKIAEQLMILTSFVHLDQGYQFHWAFTNHAKSRHLTGKYEVNYTEPIQLKNLKGANFDKDITLHPYASDLKEAFKKFDSKIKHVLLQYPKL